MRDIRYRQIGDIEGYENRRSWLSNFFVAVKYVWSDTWRQKKSFIIGCTAVWLVVLSVTYAIDDYQSF